MASARPESNGFEDIGQKNGSSTDLSPQSMLKRTPSSAHGVIFCYRNLQPKSKSKAIAQGFYPCMVRGPKPENADPSSMLLCREETLFKHNYQFAKESAKKNKKDLGLNFNLGPSAPRADGTHDANPYEIGPFYNL